MIERGPEDGQEREPDRGQDPVDRRPPEGSRPGEAGDPVSGDAQPPGEPPHEPTPFHSGASVPGPGDEHEGPAKGRSQPTFAPPPGHRPEGAYEAREDPYQTGEFSAGPSGLDQAGFEHAGYAPGYGETDAPGAGAGSFPPTGSQGRPPGGGYPPDRPAPVPWGKILGIGCGVALLLMLVAGGCMAAAMLTVSNTSSDAQEPTSEESGTSEDPPLADTQITAGTTEFEPSPLYTGGEYTSVEVRVINNSQEQIDINPLYFAVIDQDGQNHSSRTGIGMDDNEIGAQKLSPGQATSGAVTVEGDDLVPERLIFAPLGHQPLEVAID